MSGLLHIKSLSIAQNRQRKEFALADINELADSIAAIGLLQAPVIRYEGDVPILVAGERRFRAICDLHELGRKFYYNSQLVPQDHIPCTTLGELPFLAAWEAELEENIRRVDLTWQERAAATASLMELRREQAAEAGKPEPTVAQIAREVRNIPADKPDGEIGGPATETRNEIIVAKFLKDPEIAKAPTVREAIKILKKREERQKQADLATLTGTSFTASSHTLLHAEAEPWAESDRGNRFDIILTDPPYGMGADQFGDSGVGTSAAAHFYDDSYESWLAMMGWFPQASFRLAKADAHLYAFCDIDRFHEMRTLMAAAGWKVHRTPLIWHNPDGFRAPWPEYGCQRKYELILYAVKGERKVNHLKGDVLEFGKDKGIGHPAQKPVALLVELLRRSARPGDEVLDLFAGSFSTVEACHELRLSCTALERDAAAYGMGVKRVGDLETFDRSLFQ